MYKVVRQSISISIFVCLILLGQPLESVAQTSISLGVLQIVFISDRNGSYQVYSMDVNGNNVQQLTNEAGNIDSVSCSPDGKSIATTGEHGGIKIWHLDNSTVTNLFDSTAIYSSPRWSHVGDRIAFTSTKDGGFDIYTAYSDGTNVVRVTNSSTIRERLLTWSPSDNQLAFSAADPNSTGIYTVNSTGTNLVRLTTNQKTDAFPDWSIDNTKIIFASEQQGVFRIYTMTPSGTNLTAITNTSSSNWRPILSPDNTVISFTSSRDGNPEIYTMSSSGASVLRLTNNDFTDLNGCWLIPSTTSSNGGILGQYYDNIDLTNWKLKR